MPSDSGDENDPTFGPPLPRDDRLWRHPSEMADEGPKQQIVLVTKSSPSLARMAIVTIIAGLIGAGATATVLLSTDTLVRETPGRTSTERVVLTPPKNPDDSQLAVAERVLPSIARIEAVGPKGVATGTAIVFRSDGLLLTNADTIDAAESLAVYFNDGTMLEGPANVTLLGKSTDADIAVIKVNRTDLIPATGSASKATWGARAIMIDASPQTHGPEIKVGVVTKEVAEVARGEAQPPVYGLVQVTTRATVTARGAGTVFVDDAGAVIGVVTSRAEGPAYPDLPDDTLPSGGTTIRDNNDAGNALHFAVPGDFAWDIAGQIVDKGQVVRPWLGLSRGDDVPQTELNRDGAGGGGMRITFFEEDSPARKATLRIGDVIVALGKENIASYNDFVAATRRLDPGDQVDVTYIRESEISHQFVTVGGKPELP